MNRVDIMYENLWKDIVEKNGELDKRAVMNELFDFGTLIDNISKVYCHITGNQVSKPLTDPDVVCSLADEYYGGVSCLDCGGELQVFSFNTYETLRCEDCGRHYK